MDEQEFINDTELIEESFGHTGFDYGFAFAILFTVVCFILYIVSISAECFLICTICKFKRLKTRTNMYIFNCCISNMLTDVLAPFSYILKHCAFLRIRNTFIALNIIFAFALAVDWFTSCCKPNLMTVYHKYYKFVFLTIYIIMFLECAISLYICDENVSYFNALNFGTRDLCLLILYGMCLVPLLVMNCLKKKVCTRPDSFKTAYALTTSNIIIFSLFPRFLLTIIEYLFFFIVFLYSLTIVYAFVQFVVICISAGYPVLMVYMLGKQSTHFKMSYDQSFKRNTGSYTDEIVDAEYCAGDDSVEVK